jgi:tight adherence protein B
MQTYMLFLFVAVTIGALAWVFVYPSLSGERKTQARMASAARAQPAARPTRVAAQKPRRGQIEGALKEFEERQKRAKRKPLTLRISQAGLHWSKQRFVITAVALGVAVFILSVAIGAGLPAAFAFAFSAALGIPFWLLAYLKKRREARFLDALPDAVDVIVRGIKAGLPLHDSLKLISAEAREPVRSEFRSIVETQTIGIPLGEACLKLYEHIPVPEANFFGIVVSIQQRSGGNLSEALGNLSRVLRDRKRMKAKIKAMSQEAKASAAIIGSLPIAVMVLVYLTSPSYIDLLWKVSTGRMMLGAAAVWMCLGMLVMRKMINFDF